MVQLCVETNGSETNSQINILLSSSPFTSLGLERCNFPCVSHALCMFNDKLCGMASRQEPAFFFLEFQSKIPSKYLGPEPRGH